ncbi:hypothetical protein DFS34DRAFT_598929 [Phlyctochytrium arcticum]|nr:hypothetical protein DFS34DRAFT_598929 [Phlyctochytrium arcticum]
MSDPNRGTPYGYQQYPPHPQHPQQVSNPFPPPHQPLQQPGLPPPPYYNPSPAPGFPSYPPQANSPQSFGFPPAEQKPYPNPSPHSTPSYPTQFPTPHSHPASPYASPATSFTTLPSPHTSSYSSLPYAGGMSADSSYSSLPNAASNQSSYGSLPSNGSNMSLTSAHEGGLSPHLMNPAPGQAFGPYVRYGNMDPNANIWYGSVLVVTSSRVPHQITLTPMPAHVQPCTLTSNILDTYLDYSFHRFDLALPMAMGNSTRWHYSIDCFPGQPFEFNVAAAGDGNWRFAFHSCNGFSASVPKEERDKLGGVGALWSDVLKQHSTPGSEFHCMLGGGDQIYGDPLWKEIPELKQWLAMKGKENRRDAPWTAVMEQHASNFYFNVYTSHFATPNLREALSSIPSIFQIDDHDLFDGFGSYPDYLQHSHVFVNLGRVGWKFYLLFQQHTTAQLASGAGPHAHEYISPVNDGRTFHFIKHLGPNAVVVGPDTRGERTREQVLSPASYNMLFETLSNPNKVSPQVRHVVWMLAVPIVYPRLTTPETLLHHFGKTKRAANDAVNHIGKGVGKMMGGTGKLLSKVGVKVDHEAWHDKSKKSIDGAIGSVKKGLGKSGLMSGLISQFGEVDLLDDLIDHWTHPNHLAERTALLERLMDHAQRHHQRISFISGDVHCAGVGRIFHPKFDSSRHNKPFDANSQPLNTQDPFLMYQFVASAIVNIPPPKGVLKMLHSSATTLPVGEGATGAQEEMLDLFLKDVDGSAIAGKKLIGRRNWGCARIVGGGGVTPVLGQAPPVGVIPSTASATNLQVELRIESTVTGVCVPYGPIIVPPLL